MICILAVGLSVPIPTRPDAVTLAFSPQVPPFLVENAKSPLPEPLSIQTISAAPAEPVPVAINSIPLYTPDVVEGLLICKKSFALRELDQAVLTVFSISKPPSGLAVPIPTLPPYLCNTKGIVSTPFSLACINAKLLVESTPKFNISPVAPDADLIRNCPIVSILLNVIAFVASRVAFGLVVPMPTLPEVSTVSLCAESVSS